MIQYDHNEYITHHYVFIVKAVEVREPKSYREVEKDENQRADMEEDMRKLIGSKT